MKKWKIFLIFLIIVFIIDLSILFLYPVIRINNTVVTYNSNYEPEITAKNMFINLSDKVTWTSNVDTSKIGKYKLECKIKYLIFNLKKSISIYVVDRDKPTITLEGSENVKLCPHELYKEEGFNAFDFYDKDITDKVKRYEIDNNIFYVATDSSGNRVTARRTINYGDDENPVITLKGDSEMYVYLGSNFTDPMYTASDNCDGDITDKVISTGTVDTNKLGSYDISYEVSDAKGNKTQATRRVTVINRPTPNNSYGNGYIYLTFDDGPSNLTNMVLDILDEENVKATFFVTSANEATRRAYNSGHTIALHSYTHDYSYVYSSSENYFDDLNTVSNKVYEVIGIRPTIIRFPGGSSNTVSRNYKAGIMTYLTSEVLRRGYNYFDWNVDSNDAGSDIYNSSNIYLNVVNNLSHNKTNIVLMHDSGSHSATVNALRDIIRFGKNNGYTFKAITNDTPSVRHSVAN